MEDILDFIPDLQEKVEELKEPFREKPEDQKQAGLDTGAGLFYADLEPPCPLTHSVADWMTT